MGLIVRLMVLPAAWPTVTMEPDNMLGHEPGLAIKTWAECGDGGLYPGAHRVALVQVCARGMPP